MRPQLTAFLLDDSTPEGWKSGSKCGLAVLLSILESKALNSEYNVCCLLKLEQCYVKAKLSISSELSETCKITINTALSTNLNFERKRNAQTTILRSVTFIEHFSVRDFTCQLICFIYSNISEKVILIKNVVCFVRSRSSKLWERC